MKFGAWIGADAGGGRSDCSAVMRVSAALRSAGVGSLSMSVWKGKGKGG